MTGTGPGPGPAEAYELVVNGVTRRVDGALATESLLRVLRDRLGLPGSKNACEQGECGSCSVLVDGVLVCACLELAAAAAGCEITTVEGVAPAGARADAEPSEALLTDVQLAMVEAGGVQCGFCTPGFVVAIHDLLDRVPDPSPLHVREALAGNLCRCTGYGRILAAVETVVALRADGALRADRLDAAEPAGPAPADGGPVVLANGRPTTPPTAPPNGGTSANPAGLPNGGESAGPPNGGAATVPGAGTADGADQQPGELAGLPNGSQAAADTVAGGDGPAGRWRGAGS